jgi:hypothetical protein
VPVITDIQIPIVADIHHDFLDDAAFKGKRRLVIARPRRSLF